MAEFAPADVTVVTAYYPLGKAKHSGAAYMQWIQNFCRIPCSLVVFTDEETAGAIRGCRAGSANTVVVTRPFSSYRMTAPEMMAIWQRNHAIDPERKIHSPELYAAWAIKQEVVRYAIDMNPFQSDWFVWCDIGIQRQPALERFYTAFPSKVPNMCPPGRMSFLEVSPIPDTFARAWARKAPCPQPVPPTMLGGGCIVGDRAAWADFGVAYEAMVLAMDGRGEFVGKDQIVFFRMLIDRKTAKPYRLFSAQKFATVPHIEWMSFPVILGGLAPANIDCRFEETKSSAQDMSKNNPLTVTLTGGLGNQLFEIATTYAYAQRHGATLTLPLAIGGNRPHYYNTYLHAFKSYVGNLVPSHKWQERGFHYTPIPAGQHHLFGYFQSAKYFNDCSGEIRALYDPAPLVKQLVQARYAEFLTEDWKRRAIVVHVRRGDYFTPANAPIHGVLTEGYYARAIERARAEHGGAAELLVFSDDLDWCRAQPAFAGATYVDEKTDYLALYLMSQFRHYVISNSSFSWWAVWLGEPARTVIAPDRWFGPKGPQDWQDVYEPNWIRVPV
jgi:hypothetical protein